MFHQKQVRLPLILATSLLAGSHRCGPQSGDKFDFTLQQEANTTRLDDLIGSPQATADQLTHNTSVGQFLQACLSFFRVDEEGLGLVAGQPTEFQLIKPDETHHYYPLLTCVHPLLPTDMLNRCAMQYYRSDVRRD